MAKGKSRKKGKGGHRTTLQKARHGTDQHHESSVAATTAAEWESGGHGHHSPPKVDGDGVPLYGRQGYSAKALATKMQQLGIEPAPARSINFVSTGLISPRRKQPNVKQNTKVAVQLKVPVHPTLLPIAPKRPVASSLEEACEKFQLAMGEMGGVATQVLEEFRRDGKLSVNCRWRLFAWCYTRDENAVEMARNIWSLAVGELPTREDAKASGLRRVNP